MAKAEGERTALRRFKTYRDGSAGLMPKAAVVRGRRTFRIVPQADYTLTAAKSPDSIFNGTG